MVVSTLHKFRSFVCLLVVVLLAQVSHAPTVRAVTNPQNGSIGIEGIIGSAPPTQAATIVSPANGQVFTTIPITITGFCSGKLLVKIFSNNIFVGSTVCKNNSYSLKIDLFDGRNDIVARVFDALDQQGPDSPTITVTYNSAEFVKFGSIVSLTSQYALKGVSPGQKLTWPVIVNGGTAPYAISTDWGDGSSPDLASDSFPGIVNLAHVYKSSGTYNIVVKASDKNGTAAFLQLIGVATGAIINNNSGQNSSNGGTIVITKILWFPIIIGIPLAILSFWLGRRYELSALRKRIEKGWHS
jgi:hypothetical protein